MRRPSFSIIIPTYRRADRLARCAAAIAALDYPLDRFELVVVDDGGGDPGATEGALAPLRGRLGINLLETEHGGPAAARNAGAAAAAGEFLAFTDDDCRPDRAWLSALAEKLGEEPGLVVGGRSVNGLENNIYSAASQSLLAYLYEYFMERGTPFFASNNLALSRATFDDVGGFDPRFRRAAAEDREFCDRCLRRGRTLAFSAAAVVRHEHALSLASFSRQHYEYGRGARIYHCLRAERGNRRIRLEPARFYVELIRYPFRGGSSGRSFVLCLLFLLSQVANAAGYFRERLR